MNYRSPLLERAQRLKASLQSVQKQNRPDQAPEEVARVLQRAQKQICAKWGFSILSFEKRVRHTRTRKVLRWKRSWLRRVASGRREGLAAWEQHGARRVCNSRWGTRAWQRMLPGVIINRYSCAGYRLASPYVAQLLRENICEGGE